MIFDEKQTPGTSDSKDKEQLEIKELERVIEKHLPAFVRGLDELGPMKPGEGVNITHFSEVVTAYALLKSGRRLETLTRALVGISAVLAILTMALLAAQLGVHVVTGATAPFGYVAISILSAASMVALFVKVDRPRNNAGLGPFDFGLKLYSHHFPESILFFAIAPLVRLAVGFELTGVAGAVGFVSVFPWILLPLSNAIMYLSGRRGEKSLGLKPDSVGAYLSIFLVLDAVFLVGYYLG